MSLKYPIQVHGAGNFNGNTATITALRDPDTLVFTYALADFEGRVVASCSSPKPLANHAFNGGAREVLHAYDLTEAERT